MDKLTLLKGRRSKADMRQEYIHSSNISQSKNIEKKEQSNLLSLDKPIEISKMLESNGLDSILFIEKQIKIE